MPAKRPRKPQAAKAPKAEPVDPAADDRGFRERVLAVVRAIPAGQVATYGQVSKLAGHPRAARQVGRILYGLRPEERDVPWQRVINAQGGISTWRIGSGELQQGLLEAEGVAINDGHCDLKRFQWQG